MRTEGLVLLVMIAGAGASANSEKNQVNIICDGEPYMKKFVEVHQLEIRINKRVEAGIDNKNISFQMNGSKMSNVEGHLSPDSVVLAGKTDLDCETLPTVRCHMFGSDSIDDKYVNFSASFSIIEPRAGIRVNPEGDTFDTDTAIEVTCRADIKLNTSKLELYIQSDKFQKLDAKTISGPSSCVYGRTTSLPFRGFESGDVLFVCYLDNEKVDSKRVTFTDPTYWLQFHFFMTSVLLAYIPNAIVPAMHHLMTCPDGVRKIREPDNTLLKKVRASGSGVVAVVFAIWWAVVFHNHWHVEGCYDYVKFAVMEGIFLFIYPIVRGGSISTSEENRRPYTARVVASQGIITTPIICWVMLKGQPFFSFVGLEILFLTVAVPCILGFAYISYDREFEHWDKKTN